VMQAVNRQVAHYAHHAGQILFLAKHLTVTKTGKWESLSVPHGKSAEMNAKVATGDFSQRATLFSSKKTLKPRSVSSSLRNPLPF